MNPASNPIDPEWAWAPYEPAGPEDWSLAHVAHFHRRAGFGANWQTLQESLPLSPVTLATQAVSQVESADVESSSQALVTSILAAGGLNQLPAWWIHRLLQGSATLREKMTIFWHGHFATSGAKVRDPQLLLRQNRLLREHALGDFAAMVHEVSKDPAMLMYLDSDSNRKVHPNENFARELMELFTLGEGRYSEQDIRELARCFTGWEVRRNEYRFNPYQHDDGTKRIFDQRGQFGGEKGVDIVLDREDCPRFIAGKLVRYFVADEGLSGEELIEPLAVEFRESGLQIAPLVQRILSSNLFYSEHARARKFRSPIEFAVGFLRTLDGSTNLIGFSNSLKDLGQLLFFPPNVKGWNGGREWINSSTLLARANMMHDLLARSETRFGGGDLQEYCESQGWADPEVMVDRLSTLLLALPLNPEAAAELTQLLESGSGDPEKRLRRALALFVSLPVYQLA